MPRKQPEIDLGYRFIDVMRTAGGDLQRAADYFKIPLEHAQQMMNDLIDTGRIDIERNYAERLLNETDRAAQIYDKSGTNEDGEDFHIHSYRYYHDQKIDDPPEGIDRYYQVVIHGRTKDGEERVYTTSYFDSIEGAIGSAGFIQSAYEDDDFDDWDILCYDVAEDY